MNKRMEYTSWHHFIDIALDCCVFLAAFHVFDGWNVLLVCAAYWGIGATIDRNADKIVYALRGWK